MEYIERRFVADGTVLTVDPTTAPIEEVRQIIFAINLLEDIRQDAAVTLGADAPMVGIIFDTVPDVPGTVAYIKDALGTSG